MAADGAATLTQMGQGTVLQPTKKLNIVLGRIIVAVSGPVGLSQRITGEMELIWREKAIAGQKSFQAMTTIRQRLWNHVGMELRVASEAVKLIGNTAAQAALCTAVVALPVDNQPCLLQFDQQCAPEEVTDQLPFVAIGSGQRIADPFLAFLRRVFWRDHQPTLGEGEFAAVWTVSHAIETSPGGVAEPIHLATLRRGERDWEAREHTREELQEHLQAAQAAEKHLATFKKELQSAAGQPPAAETPPEPRK